MPNYQLLAIRPEQSGDAAAIREVHTAAFAREDEARLVDELRAAGNAIVSLVAEVDGQIVGHILFSPVSIADVGSRGLGLAPMAVLPSLQRRGIGLGLVREGLLACSQAGYGFVVVLGHPDYYPRFGFRRASDFRLSNEYGAEEAFMVLELKPGSLPAGGGIVRYGSEFGRFA